MEYGIERRCVLLQVMFNCGDAVSHFLGAPGLAQQVLQVEAKPN